ncbi:MAG: hypothetical protein JWP28_3682 [Phenylobacterium sp.]|jgi:hypothetical protein|uniref:DUF6491 family protein n=1 Tax=Phenylobacterium sp. TaxID=1871053 RepID=UPI002635694A|nr:DUF6491 family protein [Phenylobacterium sp.]MDB5499651.1 hypothetical protein [Phenylobacterium sp.]
MSTHVALAAGAAALLMLSAMPAAAKSPQPEHNQCFWTRMVDGFAAPDDHTLYVRVGVRDVYQFDLLGPCPDIDWNQRLALVSRSGSSICSGMDAEVVTHTQIGPQRCPVRSIRKLTPQEIAALPPRAKP